MCYYEENYRNVFCIHYIQHTVGIVLIKILFLSRLCGLWVCVHAGMCIFELRFENEGFQKFRASLNGTCGIYSRHGGIM